MSSGQDRGGMVRQKRQQEQNCYSRHMLVSHLRGHTGIKEG
jgi:hypothetical protein